jgi:phospholipase C
MGYYDGSSLAMWSYAQQYVLADHFFHAAFGGSGLNHFWLYCACTPLWRNAPSSVKANIAADGSVIKNGLVTPDGYLVNNIPSWDVAKQVPLQTMPDIGNRLDAASVSWAWYTAGWTAKEYPPVFAPFLFFPNTTAGTPGAATHLKDESDFLAALNGDALPSVAIVKPALNEHPVVGSGLLAGDQHAAALVRAVQASQYWKTSAIVVTYDEGSGLWDHVPPPKLDRWGPGIRVPAIVISPYAKHGFVDKTVYDTTSILRFIEWNWSLPPLGQRDANASNLLNAFDFAREP